MVVASHVVEVGPAAAILYARISWRAGDKGEWRATKKTLGDETGLTAPTLRGAITVLRDRGWVTTRRTSSEDATLIWSPVYAGQGQSAESARGVRDLHSPPAQSALSSLETGKKTLPRLRAVGADEVPQEVRPEVEALCQRLADRIEANGSKRPNVTAAWRTSCRLLIDRDDRTAEQVAKAIDWCQADDFWRSNVMSMPTLRKQYDRLRLAAQRNRDAAPRPAPQAGQGYDPDYAATLPPPRTDPFARGVL